MGCIMPQNALPLQVALEFDPLHWLHYASGMLCILGVTKKLQGIWGHTTADVW